MLRRVKNAILKMIVAFSVVFTILLMCSFEGLTKLGYIALLANLIFLSFMTYVNFYYEG